MKVPDFDDKDLVIFAVTILACVSMLVLADASQVVGNVVAGLFGVAVGKSASGGK